MHKLLQLLRFFSVSFFFVIYGHASIITPIPIDMNSTVEGTLTSESETSPNSHNASEYYTFTLTEEKNVIISLESDIYYKFYLLDSNGSVIKEASKHDYKNNKIVMTLAQGSYKIDVTTVFNDEFGSFNISLRENVIETNSITLETVLDGEWTSISGISPTSKNYTHHYTFTLSESTDVLIDLESNNPYLYLLDSNNSVIDSAEKFVNTHTKIVKTLQAGTYTIDVTNNSYADNTGIYTLRFKTNTIITTEIDLNSTTQGTWSLASGISPRSKQYTNYYTFTLDEERDLLIDVDTDIFMIIYLLDENNTIVKRTYNSTDMFIHLDAGSYTIDVTTLNANNVGNYVLNFSENIITNSPLELNSSVEGEWNNTSGISANSGTYSNYYTFTLTERKDIIITLPEPNSRFYILDENGKRMEKYSNFQKILVVSFDAGTYIIDVTQYSKREEPYQLSVHENIIKNEVIELNSTVQSEWSNTDGLSSDTHNYVKRYTFTLDKRTDIVIDLNSSIDSKRLYLSDSDFKTHYNTYGTHQKVNTLDAGTYIIDVTYDGIDKNKTGTFILSLKENIIENKSILFNTLTQGSWTKESGSTGYGYINQYTFSLAEKTRVNITLQSEYAKYMKLDWNKLWNYNSEDLSFSMELNKGTYVIDIIIKKWNDPYQTGDYTLFIETDVETALSVENLKIESTNAYSSMITWEKGSSDTVGYKIYLNDKLVDDIKASENSYTLSGLNPNSDYTYSIIAYNSAGESKAAGGTFKTKKDNYAWLVPVQYNILN